MSKSEKTKKYIIEKSAPIFNIKGFEGTSLSDITSATGLTKGSIYGNFKDKTEVAIESFKYNYKQISNKITEKFNTTESYSQKLLFYIEFYRNNYIELFKKGGCPLLNAAVDSDDGNELLRYEVKKTLNEWNKSIEKIINKGIKNGEIKNINASNFSSKLIATLEGSVMMSKILNDPEVFLKNLNSLEFEIKEIIIK